MLKSIGIAPRIYTGFAVVLTLLTVLAAFTYLSLNTVYGVFTEYRETARQTSYISAFAVDLYEGRMAVMKFRAAPNPETAEAAHRAFEEIATETRQAEVMFANDEVTRAAIQRLGESGETYDQTFEEVRQARDRFGEALAPMVPLAQAGGEAIDALLAAGADSGNFRLVRQASVAQRDFLLARNHTTKFIDRDDVAELEAAHERLDGALTTIAQIAQGGMGAAAADTAAAAQTAISEYAERLDALAAEAETLRHLNVGILNVLGPEMQQAYADVITRIVARQDTLGPQAVARIENTQATATIAGGVALVLGLVLAFVIGRWIAGAVQGMATDMGRMADGDLDIAVTGDEHKHELGAMARALKVFQENGREKNRLDAEARAQAERDAAAAAERARLQDDVAAVVDRAAAGDFKSRVQARYSDEGLNAFAGQLNSLIEAVASGIGETARVMEALAGGNLTATMQGSFRGAFAELQSNVNTTVSRLSETVLDIQRVSGNVSTATGEIAAGASDLSGRAENQAASLEEIAATMEQMSATVKTNAENAASAMSLATEASGRADKGGGIVSEAVVAMASIEEGSRKIADIVSVIDGFAFQTNLLALNAAVEAARAGEAGKGFAVVASEVRTLAQRSAEAARDIKGLIETSSGQVSDGVKLVEETGNALREIVESIKSVSSTVTEISEASREQSSGVDEITAALTSMDETTQQNSALADESANAARGLNDQAARLRERVSFFRVEAGGGSNANAWDDDAAADSAAAQAKSRRAG